mmetsp:Transcript_22826/g.44973  ORF Transcript_22826/g.44973 Transcript_22826/m.44973 type:complete len:211 (-) Transcript_22826:537-1169(-)
MECAFENLQRLVGAADVFVKLFASCGAGQQVFVSVKDQTGVLELPGPCHHSEWLVHHRCRQLHTHQGKAEPIRQHCSHFMEVSGQLTRVHICDCKDVLDVDGLHKFPLQPRLVSGNSQAKEGRGENDTGNGEPWVLQQIFCDSQSPHTVSENKTGKRWVHTVEHRRDVVAQDVHSRRGTGSTRIPAPPEVNRVDHKPATLEVVCHVCVSS